MSHAYKINSTQKKGTEIIIPANATVPAISRNLASSLLDISILIKPQPYISITNSNNYNPKFVGDSQ